MSTRRILMMMSVVERKKARKASPCSFMAAAVTPNAQQTMIRPEQRYKVRTENWCMTWNIQRIKWPRRNRSCKHFKEFPRKQPLADIVISAAERFVLFFFTNKHPHTHARQDVLRNNIRLEAVHWNKYIFRYKIFSIVVLRIESKFAHCPSSYINFIKEPLQYVWY